ncbi:alpha beta hydrolase fold family [Moniliophthora roreri MCA 2997]|uniref:Alpha beta hydrolase fold family n=1 Tax=Moniliophthora roreri (strain MCA 2997) TaxID=1381753 RepID=V2XC93_MONRO|nr:alpha beta hydrolase fold family [Moniliophthora roreri MCA 2997]
MFPSTLSTSMGWPTKTLLTSACIFVSLTKCAVSQATWNESSWLSITPTKNLTWVPCYDGDLECGRFQVPLNYSDPEGRSAAIALVRMKANVSVDSTDYLGPILLNPGGPGSSGVDFVLTLGKPMRQILGPQFDLVGFDPRGVSRSTPRITFFKTREERLSWERAGVHELNSSLQDNVASFWSRAKVAGRLAGERAGDILPFMNTDHTARDMLRITEAYGREKIQFWGISYGSVLGSTFAAMFPDKVERLLIDGIVDVQDDYYTTEWKTAVSNTDDTLRWFFKDCHDAGPEKCPFYESSVEAIDERLNKLYQSIIQAPVPESTYNSLQGLVDYANLRDIIFSTLYSSYLWPAMATALADLEKGNGTTLAQLLGPPPPTPSPCDPPVFEPNFIESLTAFVCNDGDVVPSSLEHAEQHYQESLKVSGWGSLMAAMRIKCSSWPSIPKNFFRGPITGNTSYPLLLIGNTADPVTPLANAHKVSRGFPGSVVLQQDSPGHGSFTSAPSLCTANVIRAYFVNGTLPEPGTVCPIDASPFSK